VIHADRCTGTNLTGAFQKYINTPQTVLGDCNCPTKHVNILTQTHYMGNKFWLYHIAILRPHTATDEQNRSDPGGGVFVSV
jgi:hypothetical protein